MTAPQDIQSLRARLSPEQRAQLDARLRGGGSPAVRAGQDIPRRDPASPALLSHAQRSLWLTWQLAPDSPAYNLAGSLDMEGPLDAGAMAAALDDLVARHDILRTRITAGDDGQALQAVQAVQPDGATSLQMPVVDMPTQAALEDALAGFAQTPFALDRQAPLRACLYRLDAQRHVLALSLHHIAADGWSLRILVDELLHCYEARLRAQPPALAPMPIQFADYAAWERQRLDGGERERQLRYWRDRLGHEHAPLALPLSHARGAVTGAAEGRHRFVWPAGLSDAVRALARARGASLFMAMTALLDLLLYRLSGQCRIRVGTPIANRGKAETHGLIGYLLNLQVLQVDAAPQMGFGELLEQVRQAVLDAQQHADLPFDMLVEALAPERLPGVHPLFQVKCTQQDAMERERSAAGVRVRMQTLTAGQAHFDLSLDFTDRAEGIECVFIHDTGLFDAQRIAVFADSLTRCARQVVAAPDAALAAIALADPVDVADGGEAPQAATVLALWNAAVERQGLGMALRAEARTASFLQLDRAANRLAAQLRAQGLGQETRIGVLAPRSPELVLGMLAVLKAGCVHVPLDPELPAERLAYQLHDCGARLLLAAQPVAWQPAIPVWPLALSDDMEPEATTLEPVTLHRDQAAYLIYTSGSTGQPKGVVISHGALANYVQGVLARLDLPAGASSMAMVSTVAADLGHTVLFGALCSGRLLHLMAPERAFDPDAFADYMHTHQVDVLKIVPSHLQALLNAARPAQVLPRHCLVLGGEATGWALLERITALQPACRVLNHYGPTETTVGTLTQSADQADRAAASLPMGVPLGGTVAHVLDAALQAVPAGLPGELFIGGAGLARGYQGRPALSAERFVASPFEPGLRLYRTGDQVRQRADGSLEFLGRLDGQVKIRGFRVEPGEVAQALREQPSVREAEVLALASEDGQLRLCAYLVREPDQPGDHDGLRAALGARLADYMLPAHFVDLPAMPLTANGKLDRRALPAPVPQAATAATDGGQAPQGATEQLLAEIWAQVLRTEAPGRHDNFFSLGGDSILALQIVARARKRGLKLTPRQLMEQQTIAALAVATGGAVAAAPAAPTAPAAPAAEAGAAFGLTPVQHWFFEQAFAQPHHWNQSVLLTLGEVPDLARLRTAVDAVVTQHEALRLRFACKNGRWTQCVGATPAQAPFETQDLSAERDAGAAIARTAAALQTTLSLERPFKAVWLDLGGTRSGRLLLIAHHLVVDAVSWRILVEDLQTAYAQLGKAQAVDLGPRTSALREWAQALQSRAAQSATQAELAHWTETLAQAGAPLPGHAAGSNTVADTVTVECRLGEDLTEQLLSEVPPAYRTQINDVLLTALARTLCAWDERDSVLVELEGHGREPWSEDMDLARSVGWFTTLYPVCLRPGADAEPGAGLKAIKEQLRAVPGKGLGYGLLRHLAPQGTQLPKLQPQLTFNYLGQLDQALDGGLGWRLAREPVTGQRAPQSSRRAWLEVVACIQRGELVLQWHYSAAVHDGATVQGLADSFLGELQALIAHCVDGGRGVTPSDFPLAGVSQQRLDSLPLPAAQLADLYPMAPLQAGIFFHSVTQEQGSAYVNQLRLDMRGLDAQRFRAAWEGACDRHDVLRTGFFQDTQGLLQWVARKAQLPLVQLDWREGPGGAATDLDDLARQERERGFDFAAPPLMRLCLVQLGPDSFHFIWTRHHLLLDGWSTARLLSEVMGHYGGAAVPAPAAQYGSYIRWLGRRDCTAARSYWQQRMAAIAVPTRLSDALAGDAVSGYGERTTLLDAAATARLAAFARAERVTLNTLVQAAWGLTLAHCLRQTTVVFGVTVSGRPADLAGAEEILGLFINTLPIVLEVNESCCIGDWLRAVQSCNVQAREHEAIPLHEIQQLAACPGQDLFDSIVVFENYPVDEALRQKGQDGLVLGDLSSRDETHYPLTLVVNQGSRLSIGYGYAKDRIGDAAVAQIAARLEQILQALTAPGAESLGALDPVPQEQLRALRDLGAPGQAPPGSGDICRLLDEQARRQPDAEALVFGDLRLSYAQLHQRANRLAHGLIGLGVGPDTRVGVATERSADTVIGMLAVLKAGGVYVPLDPDYPQERLAYMIEDSGIALLLTQSALQDRIPAAPSLRRLSIDVLAFSSEPDQAPQRTIHGDSLAYLIYTSGSTGRPKGTAVPHRVVSQLAAWQMQRLPGAFRTLLFASPCFDVSVQEIICGLSSGATLVQTCGDDRHDFSLLLDLVARQAVERLYLPFAVLQLFAEAALARGESLGHIQEIITAGEQLKLTRPLLDWLDRHPQCRLVNHYGPTESHVVSDFIVDPCNAAELPPIGRAASQAQLYVLDGQLRPVPQGMPGELHIASTVLARGYFRRPAMTADKFVADPFDGAGGRLYRTGDLVRWNAAGQLEYLGRLDHQVKIRGHRVELGEVEARLSACVDVREAVVVARRAGAAVQLVAYVSLSEDSGCGADALRQKLAQSLPDYMVPGRIVVLDALPLNANGKVDRHRLPEPADLPREGYEPPQGALESAIARIWGDILGVERVGRSDNFFELGGHSLLALRLLENLRAQGMDAQARMLFQNPVLAGFAHAVQQQGARRRFVIPENLIPQDCSALQPDMLGLVALNAQEIRTIESQVPGGAPNIQDIYPLAPLQEGIFFHHLLQPRGDVYIVSHALGFRSRELLEGFIHDLDQVIARHDVLRTAIVWEGLREPVQLVCRRAQLKLHWMQDDECAQLAEPSGDLLQGLKNHIHGGDFRIDVRQAPLIEAFAAHDVPAGRWLLVFASHHIVLDHATLDLAMDEIALIQQGRHGELPEPVPFRNFVAHARHGIAESEHEAFFSDMLGDVDEPTTLLGMSDVLGDGRDVEEVRASLEDGLAAAVRLQSQRHGVSSATLFHLAWAQTLAQLTGKDDVVFGTVLFGRMDSGQGAHRSLGLFINTLPMRVRLGSRSLRCCLMDTHGTLASLLHHEHASLALAQRCSSLPGDVALFSSLLNYRYSRTEGVRAEHHWEGMESLGSRDRTNYPATVGVDDLGQGFSLAVQVIKAIGAARVHAVLLQVLHEITSALAERPDMAACEIKTMPADEWAGLLDAGSNTERHAHPLPVHELMERQARLRPRAPALVCGDVRLDYGTLNARANRLARHLVRQGLRPGVRVGLCVERNADMVLGVLAVLKAGAAYVPMDPEHPAQRLLAMAQDSGLGLLLVHGHLRPHFAGLGPDVAVMALDGLDLNTESDADLGLALHAEQLAYVIYTSGSTGKPKGVMVRHAALSQFILSMQSRPGMQADDVLLAVTSLSFDIAALELYLPLSCGAQIVLAPRSAVRDGQALARLVEASGTTVLQSTPAGWRLLLAAGWPARPPMRLKGLCGGEALHEDLAQELQTLGVELWNMYGPTETTIWSSAQPVVQQAVPEVGHAIADTRLLVLDAGLRPVPEGVTGELYIGGAGLARGYSDRPGLSAERFVADPFRDAGERLYRTGDLVRWTAPGRLQYLSRMDHQVKVRGFRIELGEIEAQLLAQPEVREAVVVARPDPEGARLLAYVVAAADTCIDAAQLRQRLGELLPDYMLPSGIGVLEALPLNVNGKVDRRRLPAVEFEAQQVYEAPSTEAEQMLAGIWTQLLGVEKVGRNDSFFAMGGHSLLAVQLVARVQGAMQGDMEIRDVFQNPVLSDMAACLRPVAAATDAKQALADIDSFIDSIEGSL